MVAQPKIQVELIKSGFIEPLDIANAGDERLFIVERAGVIKILYPDNTVGIYMDITAIVGSDGGEQGLLGLAFHPEYAANGYFFVNYTDVNGDTHIARFTRTLADSATGNPDSELNLLFIDQPAANHNGGDLNFGPDGYLYISMGDGGGAGHNRSQAIVDNKLGKILRIDVDGGIPYSIPWDNPFVGIAGDDEIWAIGLRNPWRSNFDRLTGDYWIADVGAGSWEEINFIASDTTAFMNFGWKCYEGNMLREGTLCDTIIPDFDFPVFDYPHNIETGGFAVTGGFVYRGTEFPNLYGKYIFCDYISGNFWSLEPNGTGGFTAQFYDYVIDHITSFGEDVNGEIFACVNESGNIYKILDGCAGFDATLMVTDANAPTLNNGAVNLTVLNGNAPFEFNWSNGAITEDITALPEGNYEVTITDYLGCSVTKNGNVNYLCQAATGVIAAPTATTVNLNWDDVGAVGYRVLYKPIGPGAFTQLNSAVSVINISGLTPSTAYTFKIRNKCPGAPGSFTATGNFITLPLKSGINFNEIIIFPNPSNGEVTISGISKPCSATVFDIQGRVRGNYLLLKNGTIDLSALANGIYYLYLSEYQLFKKLIIVN